MSKKQNPMNRKGLKRRKRNWKKCKRKTKKKKIKKGRKRRNLREGLPETQSYCFEKEEEGLPEWDHGKKRKDKEMCMEFVMGCQYWWKKRPVYHYFNQYEDKKKRGN